MTNFNSGTLDLLALPLLQRKIVVYLTRHGAADAATLAEVLEHDLADIKAALTGLAEQGRLYFLPGGQAEVNLGRTRPKQLPARLWPALTASNRLYSTQEIATLQTAIPMLQFARAKLSEFADHGPAHALRVKAFATQLGYILHLSPTEQNLLRAAALFHDVGNIVERDQHHLVSQETIAKLTAAGRLPFSLAESELVGLLCRWHRRDYEPQRCDQVGGESVRTGLLASILRVADAMDIDHRRSDYTGQFAWVLKFFYPAHLPYWTSLEEIRGVRIRCTPAVTLQVFTQGQADDNIQIGMLRRDLAGTPLPWSIQEIALTEHVTGVPRPTRGAALLVFPFEPHSLIMAALSRRHLGAAGYCVNTLCYPDTVDGLEWLWREALKQSCPADFAQLVVINDRPVPGLKADVMTLLSRWRAAGVAVTLLNRHEAAWSRLPELLPLGVEATLGGDWGYFWGNTIGPADFTWGRLAALCTRDSIQFVGKESAQERAVAQGLLQTVYDAIRQSPPNLTDLSNLAESILARIEADDRAYFAGRADEFVAAYATAGCLGRPVGRIVLFEAAGLGDFPQAHYYALEAAIESRGRTLERGIHFNIPYALAAWPEGEEVAMLAINHWRDEETVPIRLLYPSHLAPPPEGNEHTVWVRLPATQAENVIQALVEACNKI